MAELERSLSKVAKKKDVVTSSCLRQTAWIKRRYQVELEQKKALGGLFKAAQGGVGYPEDISCQNRERV